MFWMRVLGRRRLVTRWSALWLFLNLCPFSLTLTSTVLKRKDFLVLSFRHIMNFIFNDMCYDQDCFHKLKKEREWGWEKRGRERKILMVAGAKVQKQRRNSRSKEWMRKLLHEGKLRAFWTLKRGVRPALRYRFRIRRYTGPTLLRRFI